MLLLHPLATETCLVILGFSLSIVTHGEQSNHSQGCAPALSTSLVFALDALQTRQTLSVSRGPDEQRQTEASITSAERQNPYATRSRSDRPLAPAFRLPRRLYPFLDSSASTTCSTQHRRVPTHPMATATAAVAPPSTSTSSVLLRRRLPSPAPASASAAFPRLPGPPPPPPRRARLLLLQVALTSEVASDDVAAEEAAAAPKIGRRVRVTAPLRVHHVIKAPDLDVQGMEGVVKQYVGVWKGKRVTANLPFKVEVQLAVEGQPKPVRFFVHLREDEFEFVDGE
jgi:hypothetical protein